MFKVIIVDDEATIRNGIKCFVDWEALGCTVVYEAESGLKARDYLLSHPADIVITDISMPGMDGIALARFIHEKLPQIKILFLTAYAEFSYAKQAIHFQVVDFILKSNPLEQIAVSVRKAVKLLQDDRQRSDTLEAMEQRLQEVLPALQGKFLNDILNGLVSESDIQEIRRQLGISFPSYRLLLFAEEGSRVFEGPQPGSRTTMKAVIDLLGQELRGREHYLFPIEESSAAAVIDGEVPDRLELETVCVHVVRTIGELLNSFCRASVSAVHASLSELPIALWEARKALQETRDTPCERELVQYIDWESIGASNCNDIVKRAVGFIRSHYSEPIGLGTVAEHVFVSEAYLSRLFKKELNIAMVTYIQNCRIEAAEGLLRERNLRSCEVADLVGIGNPAYFSKLFKKKTGLTPREYRNGVQAGGQSR